MKLAQSMLKATFVLQSTIREFCIFSSGHDVLDSALLSVNAPVINRMDLRNMGVKMWGTGAFDRTEWTSVVREARSALEGL